NYSTLRELVHQTVKVEIQLRRRSSSRRSTTSSRRDKEKEKVRSDKSPKKGSEPSQGHKKIVVTPSPSAPRTKSHDCERRRKVVSGSSHGETSTFIESKSNSDDSRVKGDLLMVKRGSCINVASERLVSKLALPIIVRPTPYRL
ncbi:hypothetical protein CR513_03875, partial [Mucuna pruriens]